jgi:GrpB-like predicted nucleotidyltransferase (UPF0157 family)
MLPHHRSNPLRKPDTMSLGLIFPAVRLAAYTPEWAAAFAEERDRILSVLGERLLGIEHVGSTSVPGISAKPIIDIAVAVSALSLADAFVPDMARIGYDDAGDGGIPGQRVFGRGPRIRTHLMHVVVAGGTQWRNYLAFRNAFLSDAELAKEYDSFKRVLAAQFPDDRRSYTGAKGEFIERVLLRGAG